MAAHAFGIVAATNVEEHIQNDRQRYKIQQSFLNIFQNIMDDHRDVDYPEGQNAHYDRIADTLSLNDEGRNTLQDLAKMQCVWNQSAINMPFTVHIVDTVTKTTHAVVDCATINNALPCLIALQHPIFRGFGYAALPPDGSARPTFSRNVAVDILMKIVKDAQAKVKIAERRAEKEQEKEQLSATFTRRVSDDGEPDSDLDGDDNESIVSEASSISSVGSITEFRPFEDVRISNTRLPKSNDNLDFHDKLVILEKRLPKHEALHGEFLCFVQLPDDDQFHPYLSDKGKTLGPQFRFSLAVESLCPHIALRFDVGNPSASSMDKYGNGTIMIPLCRALCDTSNESGTVVCSSDLTAEWFDGNTSLLLGINVHYLRSVNLASLLHYPRGMHGYRLTPKEESVLSRIYSEQV